jgi:hypothetical protein
MGKLVGILFFGLLLGGCSSNPSELTCNLLRDEQVEVSNLVDYWSDLSRDRALTPSEMCEARIAQDSLIQVLAEIDLTDCSQ